MSKTDQLRISVGALGEQKMDVTRRTNVPTTKDAG